MFKVTREWLWFNYGSKGEQQYNQCRDWLLKYGKDVPREKLDDWARWKHLAEYQPNTKDIVDRCTDMIGRTYDSELVAHREINILRVPISKWYIVALNEINPISILELGVGGDSAISTAVFLAYLEGKKGASMVSVDYNPLGTTWVRYGKVPFWKFIQQDSVKVLESFVDSPMWFDMVFIDTIHSYEHTRKEVELSSKITDAILMDDIFFPGNDFDAEPGGVRRAWEEWQEKEKDWNARTFDSGKIGLLTRKIKTAREVGGTVAGERPRQTGLAFHIPDFEGIVEEEPEVTKSRKKRPKRKAVRTGTSRSKARTESDKGSPDKT